jgi:hypothetical protein
MDTKRFHEFFQSKIELGRLVIKEMGEQAEPDAEIILCCALSGLAAILWPGTGIDRQRFIQMLVDFDFSQPSANLRQISIPVLASQLRDEGDVSSAINLKAKFFPGHPSEFFDPKVVDQDEATVSAVSNSLSLKTIRRASYASIIYTDLRCALVHEYNLSENMTSFNLFDIHNAPSYLHMNFEDGRTRMLLHLPFGYLVDALTNITEALFAYWRTSSSLEKPRPLSWWADG